MLTKKTKYVMLSIMDGIGPVTANRIIAALSDTLHVIDAGRHSGTDSTVEFSRDYGRRVERGILSFS